MNLTLDIANITITGKIDLTNELKTAVVNAIHKASLDVMPVNHNSYQYPQAIRFDTIAQLAKRIADDIESNNGHMVTDEALQDVTALSRVIDYLCDSGHLNLKSVKVVQGLSISEIMRLANTPNSDQV